MRGNTNANTSGGGGSVGNESALDLLIAQNTAKANLATNLQGKGIEANATTETLNELVNKVPNIQSSSDRELLNETLTLDILATMNPTSTTTDTPYVSPFIYKIKDYFFIMNFGSTCTLSYCKIQDLEDNIVVSSSQQSFSSYITTVESFSGNKNCSLSFSKDATKLFITIYNTTTNNLRVYNIVWEDDIISSVSLNKVVTLLNDNNAGCRYVYFSSANSNGNKLLVSMTNNSNKTRIFLYDIINDTNTLLTGISYLQDSPTGLYVNWITDSEFVLWQTANSPYHINIQQYSIDGTTVTPILLENVISSTINFSYNNYSNYCNNVHSFYEYDINKYKLIISGQNSSSITQYPDIIIYDTYTHELNEYKGEMLLDIQANKNIGKVDVFYNEEKHRYFVYNGFQKFFIFDENWNLLNSISCMTELSSPSFSGLYFGNDSMFCFNSSTTGFKVIYWYGKKTIIKRTVSINEQVKEIYYAGDRITQADIEAGYYD